MRIVRRDAIVPMRRLCAGSFFFGSCLFVPMFALIPIAPYLLDPVAGRPNFVSTVFTYALPAFATLIGPLIGFIRWREQIADGQRRTAAIFWTAAGVLSVSYALAAYGLLMSGDVNGLLFLFLFHGGLFVVWHLIAYAIRRPVQAKWPFQMQDGESCPVCGYCVRGVTSMICPECGKSFSNDDLELSVDEFERLISGQSKSIS